MDSNESDGSGEQLKPSAPTSRSQIMTLQKAVDLGEYNPEFLGLFQNGVH
jgi:hypothetical protein